MPAIIDTGSTLLSIPPQDFDEFAKHMKNDLAAIGVDLNCDDVYCYTDENVYCDDIAPHLSSVGLLMADHVFDLAPETWLNQWADNCEILIEKNTLPDGWD